VQRWRGHTIVTDTEPRVVCDGRCVGDPDGVPCVAIGVPVERREHVREFDPDRELRPLRECEPVIGADRNGSANGDPERDADRLVEPIPIAERDPDAASDRIAHAVRFHAATVRAVETHVVRVPTRARFGIQRYEGHQFQ
jgi:hypothetical protein